MSIKIKAKEKKGVVTVKAIAKHPMLSQFEADRKKGKANFITHLMATVGGETVFEISTSPNLSKNPYFKFEYKGNKGDEITMKWVDLSGATKSESVKVK